MIVHTNIEMKSCLDASDGRIMLCLAFAKYMNKRKDGVPNYTQAILWLEHQGNGNPVYDFGDANDYVRQAINIAYGLIKPSIVIEVTPYVFKTKLGESAKNQSSFDRFRTAMLGAKKTRPIRDVLSKV